MKYTNIVVTVNGYATDSLQKTLKETGERGFKLVNAMLAKNKYNIDVMYLFFTKEETEVAEMEK